MKVYKFDDIIFQGNNLYSIQGRIIHVKNIKNDCITITSIIAADVLDKQIEIIAFNESAQYLIKQQIKENSFYSFYILHTQKNLKFKRTNHKCKLVFELPRSKLSKIHCLEYKCNDKLFVKEINKKKGVKNKQQNIKQLSIKSFFK